MWYSLDFDKLSKLLLPGMLRKPKIMAYLSALVTPIGALHYVFTQFRIAEPYGTLYRLKHTGQVCYLKKALNDNFDISQRRINIKLTGTEAIGTYLRTYEENEPKFLGTIYLRDILEFGGVGADFIVQVPASIITTREAELRYIIDFYKLASKRYLIEAI